MNINEFREHLMSGRWSKKSSARIAIGQAFKNAPVRTKNMAIAEADAYFEQLDKDAQPPVDTRAEEEEEEEEEKVEHASRLNDLITLLSGTHSRRALRQYLKKARDAGLTTEALENEVEVLAQLVD